MASGSAKEYLDNFYQKLYEKLCDEHFDISAPISKNGNSYELINILRDSTNSEYSSTILWRCAYLYLQRLRREHIIVFSANKQWFDRYLIDDVESGNDQDGFKVMLPTYCGRYDEIRHQRRLRAK